MDSLEPLFALLWANPAFRAASPGGISAILLPQGVALPATSAQVVSRTARPTFSTSGLQVLRVQFDSHANDSDGAAAGRKTLRQILNGFAGVLADGTYLQLVELAQEIDFFDSETRRFRASSEYYLYFNLID